MRTLLHRRKVSDPKLYLEFDALCARINARASEAAISPSAQPAAPAGGESSQGQDEDPGSIQQQEQDDGGAASELKEELRRDHDAEPSSGTEEKEAESGKIMETEEQQGGERKSVSGADISPSAQPAAPAGSSVVEIDTFVLVSL